MKLIDFGRIEQLAREAKKTYQELETRVGVIEADGRDPADSPAVAESQAALQDLLTSIESETEHVSLGTHRLTRGTAWLPSNEAAEIVRDGTTVTVRVNERISTGAGLRVKIGGVDAETQFDLPAESGDEQTYEDVPEDADVVVEWTASHKRVNTTALPNGYRKNISNDSLAGLRDPPSAADSTHQMQTVNRGEMVE